MKTSGLLSLALVTHRDPEGLVRLLSGLRRSFRSSGFACPILVIENGAPDDRTDEREIRREFSGLDLQWVRLSRNSMCEARQFALQSLTTPWVAFLDSDCRVFPRWSEQVERRLSSLEANPEIWAWGSPVLNRGRSVGARINRWFGRAFPGHARIRESRRVSHVPSSQIFYRREAVLAAGGFPEGFDRVGEDLSLSKRIAGAGGEIWIFPEPLVLHAQESRISTHLLRLERYGRAQGALFRQAPSHLGDRRFLPLFVSMAVVALFAWQPLGMGITAALAAALWFWRGPRMGSGRAQTAGFIFVLASVLCYAWGTARGVLQPGSVRR